jgi:FkbM family methyltransferase
MSFPYFFYYGIDDNHTDITQIVVQKCILYTGQHALIPAGGQNLTELFGDPFPGQIKYIYIYDFGNKTVTKCNETRDIHIYIVNNTIQIVPSTNFVSSIFKNVYINLLKMQKEINLQFGEWDEEMPETLMSSLWLKGNEKVLEIGGNIGRNSLIIGKLLQDSRNLVTMECGPKFAEQLEINRDNNNLHFHIEKSALSKRKLIQYKWTVFESLVEEIPEGFERVQTITLPELRAKYPIEFDTLILDCEGSFYTIILDYPEILDNIKLVIVENDYKKLEEKQYVDKMLIERGLKCVYSDSGGWLHDHPCVNNFYEVWSISTLDSKQESTAPTIDA